MEVKKEGKKDVWEHVELEGKGTVMAIGTTIRKFRFLRRDPVPSIIRALSVLNCFRVPVGKRILKAVKRKRRRKDPEREIRLLAVIRG